MSKLILLRHGQSLWNLENKFTGWHDVDLSETGVNEAVKAGKLLAKHSVYWDVAFTSYLGRAIRTLHLAASSAGFESAPEYRRWRLNERHYGALQGLDKSETAKKYGDAQVKIWRRSYDIPPPFLDADDPRAPKFEKKYELLDPKSLPLGESLKDTINRVVPCWQDDLAPLLREGKTVMVAAHGNSLRALVKYLKKISDSDIVNLEIPTGIPQIFELSPELEVICDEYLD